MVLNPIPIFYYHSVAPAKNPLWVKSFLTFELIYFEDLLKYLVSQKFEFLDLDEYFIRRTDPVSKNKKMICLTFDDGYLDNYVYVYPLLKKFKAKGTIFVSPDYVQTNNLIRPTIEDVWAGKINESELESLGFLSWEEMSVMVESGFVDIQSHTISHTKYYSSDSIREFHHPKADYLYPIGNHFPDYLPSYITNPDFNKLIPYGTPFFEEKSSIICKRVFINKEFESHCVEILKNEDWSDYSYIKCFEKIKNIYEEYKTKDKLIVRKESEIEYAARVIYEIEESKKIIEAKLNKTINHICWPHGDYNDYCHEVAKRIGFKSSHIVLKSGEVNTFHDRFDRTGSSIVKKDRYLTLLKARYKIDSYRGVAPYSWIKCLYNLIKYGK